MNYCYHILLLCCFIASTAFAQDSRSIHTIKIRKRVVKVPFAQALTLPETATSCDCPPANYNRVLRKVGCQHPDTMAVCKVVITQFDVAIIPEYGEAHVFKNVEGSFLTGRALGLMNRFVGDNVFISYSNIKGMTEDGKEVIVPSFGTTNPRKRANRSYNSIKNYLSNIDNTQINSFELLAYNENNQVVFRQAYTKELFDQNAIRPDATRYLFKTIKARHSSGFEVEIDNFQVDNIQSTTDQLLSSNE